MKNRNYVFYGVLSLCLGWVMLSAQEVRTVKENFLFLQEPRQTFQLVEKEDSLHLMMDFYIPSYLIQSHQAWNVIPEVVAGENKQIFPSILINGKKRSAYYQRRLLFKDKKLISGRPLLAGEIESGKYTHVSYLYAIPYESWMDTASLSLQQIFYSCRDKEEKYVVGNLTNVQTQPYIPYIPAVYVNYIEPRIEEKVRQVQGTAYLDFESGKTIIKPSYRRNPEELAKIANSINEVTSSEDVRIRSIRIEGFASPEGSVQLNDRLSMGRAEALSNYLSGRMAISRSLFHTYSRGEDWEGLKRQVTESFLPEKLRILDIIDSADEPDRKEVRLKNLGSNVWQELMKNYFPALRRVEYRIDYIIREYSMAEAEELLERNPGHLSLAELFVVAQTYGINSEKWNEIMRLSVLLYPDDPVANINAAAVAVITGDMESAGRYLEKVKEEPLATNNRGAWYMLLKEVEKAEENLRQADAQGIESAQQNLYELEQVKADIEKENKRSIR